MPDTEVQVPSLNIGEAPRSFVLHPRGASHMFMELILFNLHLYWAQLQFSISFIFTSCEEDLKNCIVATGAHKNVKPLGAF
jgi:hypothetical protein